VIGRAWLTIRFGGRTATVGLRAAAATAATPPAALPRPVFPAGSVFILFRLRGPEPIGRVFFGLVSTAEIVGQPIVGRRQIPRIPLIGNRLPTGAGSILVGPPRRPAAIVALSERLVVPAAGSLVAVARCL